MKRRKVLKSIGSASGAGAIIASGSHEAKANDGVEPTKSKGIYSNVEVSVVNSNLKPPLVSKCRQQPTHTIWKNNKNRVFLNQLDKHSVAVEGKEASENKIVALSNGLFTGGRSVIETDLTPWSSSALSNSTLITGSPNQRINISRQTSERFEIEFAGNKITCDKNETSKGSVTKEISFGLNESHSAEMTIQVKAAHYGKAQLITHPINFVYPRNKELKERLKNLKRRYDKYQTAGESKIVNHGYAYEFIPQRGQK